MVKTKASKEVRVKDVREGLCARIFDDGGPKSGCRSRGTETQIVGWLSAEVIVSDNLLNDISGFTVTIAS